MTNQPTIEDTFTADRGDALVAAAANVARLGACSIDYDALSDAAVLAGQRTLAQAQRELDTRKAWMAKTLAQRSRWERREGEKPEAGDRDRTVGSEEEGGQGSPSPQEEL